MSKPITCITCDLTFGDSGIMREHFRSDFHRFNLKRKVAKLPPVSLHLFQQKISGYLYNVGNFSNFSSSFLYCHQTPFPLLIVTKELQSQSEQSVPKGKQHLKRDKVQKNKQNQTNWAKNPPHSHEENSIQDQNKSHEENKTEDEMIEEKIATSPVLTLKDSLFDRHQSVDFESNLQYMTQEFGFFIPELEYLKDLPGLIIYLGQKISVGNTCIYCEKTFYSMEATRDHMRDVSHCKILWDDNENEYSDYYDLDAADRRFLPAGPDGDGTESVYISKNNELVLSNNKVLGHRALQVYYKQRTHTEGQQLITSLMQEHKRLAALEKQRQLNLDNKAHQKRLNFDLKKGLKNNYQKHYREQNPK